MLVKKVKRIQEIAVRHRRKVNRWQQVFIHTKRVRKTLFEWIQLGTKNLFHADSPKFLSSSRRFFTQIYDRFNNLTRRLSSLYNFVKWRQIFDVSTYQGIFRRIMNLNQGRQHSGWVGNSQTIWRKQCASLFAIRTMYSQMAIPKGIWHY